MNVQCAVSEYSSQQPCARFVNILQLILNDKKQPAKFIQLKQFWLKQIQFSG